jgi:excisionase family DNA binding protein
MDHFVSIAQVAAATSLSSRYLYILCKDKKLPHFKVGKRILVRPEDIENFIKSGAVQPVDRGKNK